jgi:flagellar basal body-associated protein FliL
MAEPARSSGKTTVLIVAGVVAAASIGAAVAWFWM